MKRLLMAVALVLMSASYASAVDVVLKWRANTEPDLGGYHVHIANTSGGHDKDVWFANIPAGTEKATYNVTTEGTYYFVVTAYDTEGLVSGFSNEVYYTLITAFKSMKFGGASENLKLGGSKKNIIIGD